MSAPHADDRTPARPEGRRNGHPTTLLTGAASTDGDPAPGTAAPAPGPVPAPRAGDGTTDPAGTPPEPAPEPTELTGPVDVRNRPGPRTPPMPWPAVPAEERSVGGVPAQRTGPGGAGSDRTGGAAPSPPRSAAGPHAPWTAVPAPGRAPFPTAPRAAPVRGGGRAAAPVPVVYPPGHAASGNPAGRWDALRDRLSAARLPDGGLRGAVPHRAAAIAVAATLVLAAAVVVAAYVGSERTGDPGAPQGSGTGIAPVAAPADLVAGTTAADPAAFGSPASFTSPTGNISCRITGGVGDGAVRCDVTARTWSAGDCPDAALVTGGPAGARTECGGAPVGSGAAVLDYGTHLTEGDVTCVSSRTGVECRDARTGAGFTAARAAYRLY